MPRKQILIVEDNQINRMMLGNILSSEYDILEAENGQEALSILREHREDISLILLDIVMPVMDGYTFLSTVKAEPSYASIPVIVTTQSDSESDEVAALAHGAADFVAKPYKSQVILHRVTGIINLRETAAMINQFTYDQLTGLYSKEFFYQRARELLGRRLDQEYDIICSDIENFKLINDVFGVPAGDRILRGVADVCMKFVGDRGICGRFNADRFACLLERRHDYSDELFVQAGAQVNRIPNTKNIAIDWGIYEITDRSIPVEQMCDRAQLAARSIKGQYGKHFAAYDDKLRSKLLRQQDITDEMESALAGGQFLVYLQPKYSISDDRLAGAEALVRWNHPRWGFQSPDEFIPLFEKNGFITKLDKYVWDKVCAMLREWDDMGYPPISISVNVSRADVYQTDMADTLMKLVEKYGISPFRLHLEITESAYTEDPDQIIDTVGHLRELGFVVEMDDFGSGYSSLSMLNKMPLDILKLDMKFIQSETAKPLDQGILRFIMSLARWMNLSVVAEGVETRKQLERLREIGCDYVQGYYFAKPMPREEFEPLLRDRRRVREEWSPCRPVPDQESRGQSVLLVADEDADYRRQVRATFEEKFRVVEASDGQSALDMIGQHDHQIAAVILSLTLTGPDSFAVLDMLQRNNAVWNTTIIATALADAELEERALELGVDDFAAKPHTQQSLWKRTVRAVGMSAFRERERMLQNEACRDYLTGRLNRRGLSVAVNELRKEDGPFGVYLFDLDNLKQINDTFGHVEGDRVLERFGELLSAHARGSDVVARLGGDEFIVIMKHMNSETAATNKGEEICKALRDSCRSEAYAATCSVGITLCTAKEPMARMIAEADEALYCAKVENKGGSCLRRE